MSKFFVVMKPSHINPNKLVCIPRHDPVHDEMMYAYKSRSWAEKYAEKTGGAVYSVQGLDLATHNLIWNAPSDKFLCHWLIRDDAERQFNPR